MRKPTIYVYDYLPGTGKSTHIMDIIRESDVSNTQWLYITPLLSEAERIANGVRHTTFIHPPNDKHLDKYRNKTEWALHHYGMGYSIATTHQLYKRLKELPESIMGKSYLVIDEAIEPLEHISIPYYEIKQMLEADTIAKDSNGRVYWTNKVHYSSLDTTSDTYKMYTLLEREHQNIYIYNNNAIWELQIDALDKFDKVFILTHNFENTILETFLKMYGYEIQYIKAELRYTNDEVLHHMNTCITLMDTSSIEEKGYQFSFSYWDTVLSYCKANRMKDLKTILKNLLHNVEMEDVLYTCPKDFAPQIIHYEYKEEQTDEGKDPLYKVWLPSKTKATNDYAHKTDIVYLYDKYLNPNIIGHLKVNRGIETTQKHNTTYAINELMQFIFISAIRNGKQIRLYLPSSRMRNLLKKMLNQPLEKEYKRHNRCKLTEYTRNKLIEDAADGMPKSNIAKKYGISRMQVHRILKEQ